MKKRLIATILFILLFTAASVYVVILAQGNKFGNDGSVVNTSIIRINSIPTDVVVYINGQQVDKVDNRVEWLTPGETNITLKKEGYKSWSKKVTLKAGVVEDVYAQLYPERLQFERLTNKNIDQFYISDNSDFIYYTILKSEISSDIGIWRLKLNRSILDFSKNEPEKIFDLSEDVRKNLKSYSLIISPDNSKAFINSIEEKIIYLADFNSKSLLNINNEVGFAPESVTWFEGSSSAVFATSQFVSTYDVSGKQLNLVYFSGSEVPIYSVGSNVIYYYRSDLKKFYKYQSKSNSVLDLKSLDIEISAPLELIISKDSDKLFFVKAQDFYYFVDLDKTYIQKVASKGSLLKVSPNGKGYLERIDGSTLSASFFKDNLDKKTYTYNNYDFSTKEGLEFLDYTDNSQNIIFVMANELGREVWMSDYDGHNLASVISNEVLASEKVLIANNSIDLYVLLEDSSSSIDNSKINNIYRFKLRIE